MENIKLMIKNGVDLETRDKIIEMLNSDFFNKYTANEINDLVYLIKENKISSVHNQDFEKAAYLRDIEKKLFIK